MLGSFVWSGPEMIEILIAILIFVAVAAVIQWLPGIDRTFKNIALLIVGVILIIYLLRMLPAVGVG